MTDTALPGVIPPHGPRNDARVADLVDAYKHRDRLPAVVALRFGDELRAISGSHRLAAMGARYSSPEEAEEDGALVIVDAAELVAAAGARNDSEALHWLTNPEKWNFFPALLKDLWPYLPEEARYALRSDERL
jgi:hypothetical protein